MKLIQKKVIWFAVLAAVGVLLTVLGLITGQGEATYMQGFGVGLLAAAVAKMIQMWIISRNPERVKKAELLQNEERLVAIARVSGYLTLLITILLGFVAAVVLMILNKTELASMVCYGVAGLTLLYLVVRVIVSKRM